MESTAQYWKPVWLDLEPYFEGQQAPRTEIHPGPKKLGYAVTITPLNPGPQPVPEG
jgi:hypothetical protein